MDAKVLARIGPVSRARRDLIEAAEMFLHRAREVADTCDDTFHLNEEDINRQFAERRVVEAKQALAEFERVAHAVAVQAGRVIAPTTPILWAQRCERTLNHHVFSFEQWQAIIDECVKRDYEGESTSPREVAGELLGIFDRKAR